MKELELFLEIAEQTRFWPTGTWLRFSWASGWTVTLLHGETVFPVGPLLRWRLLIAPLRLGRGTVRCVADRCAEDDLERAKEGPKCVIILD